MGNSGDGPGSGFALGLGEADRAAAFLPLAALLEELDAFEALHDGAFACGGAGCFETAVLGHGKMVVGEAGGAFRGGGGGWQGGKSSK